MSEVGVMPAVAERPQSQLQPRGGPRDLGPASKVNGHDPASAGSLVASAPPRVPATLALDVGEQICRLQALAELRAAGVLTDGELADLKRRVLSSGSDAPLETLRAGMMQAPRHIGGPASTEAAAAGNGHVPPADKRRRGQRQPVWRPSARERRRRETTSAAYPVRRSTAAYRREAT